MAGKEYRAKEKTVSKMTKEGIVEESLSTDSGEPIDPKSRGKPVERTGRLSFESRNQERDLTDISRKKAKERIRNLSDPDESTPLEDSEHSLRDKKTYQKKASRYQNKLRDQELIPEDTTLSNQKETLKKKQQKARLTKEQAKSGRLSFGDEGSGMIKGAGIHMGKAVSSSAALYAKEKYSKEMDENAATDALSDSAIATEKVTESLKRTQIRSQRSDVRKHRKGLQGMEMSDSKLRFESEETVTSGVLNSKEKSKHFNRFFQRKRYKDVYRATKMGKEGAMGGATTIAGVENMTIKAKVALKETIMRNRTVLLGIGIFMLFFMLIAVSISSCTASIEGGGSVIGMTTYPSKDADIYAAEKAYADLEKALNEQINNMESTHPNYDSYKYDVAEIGHNPYHLISYLTVKYGGFKYDDVKDEIKELFQAQYHLKTQGKTETITETKTVRVGESLGQVVTSGYCNCRICCGRWSGGPTASGAYPRSNHTIAVDANNPIVPLGTKVVMNGVEYTVEDTGNFARYGVAFDVYYDSHAASSAHGHKTWEAFLADSNGNREVTVTTTSTQRILYVTLTNTNFDAVVRELLTDEEEILYDALNTTLGNRNYLWDVSQVSGNGGGMSYDVPPEALSDQKFAKMYNEAKKYLGYPYVWGGASPSTSFDCSGYVSWVINHCGNGWNFGRLTADGLRSKCTYVSPSQAKPGDLIFFEKTYNTSGASHVGIYLGNGMMIHCGNPIQYANINSSYWQNHFLCFGRLP